MKDYVLHPRAIAALLATCYLLSACQAPAICRVAAGCVFVPPDQPLVIGVLRAWLGPHAAAGTETLAGIKRAVEERSYLLGHHIVLNRAGSECTQESARMAATALLTDADVFLIIGPTCAVEVAAITPLLQDAGVFLATPLPGEEAAYRLTIQILDSLEEIAIQSPDGALYLPRRDLDRVLGPLP